MAFGLILAYGTSMEMAPPLLKAIKVKDLIGHLQDDGWRQVRMRGSHRQFRHPTKPGTVTVAGELSADVPSGTLANVLKQAGLKQ